MDSEDNGFKALTVEYFTSLRSYMKFYLELRSKAKEIDISNFIGKLKLSARVNGFPFVEEVSKIFEFALDERNVGRKISEAGVDTQKLQDDSLRITDALANITGDLTEEKAKEIFTELGLLTGDMTIANFGVEDLFTMSPGIDADTILTNQSFISCMTVFEGLVYNLCQILFNLKPNALSQAKRSLSLSELRQLGSIDEAITYMIDAESDEVMRKSMSEWFDFMRDKFEINFREIYTDYNKLIEAYQRRNVIIHHKGRASKQYVDQYGRTTGIKLGQKIDADEDYFHSSFALIYISGILLINRAWKADKKHIEKDRLTMMNLAIVSAMHDELWKVVEVIAEEIIEEKSLRGSLKMTCQVNLWLSKKRQGNLDEIMTELLAFDHDVASDKYSCVVYALKNDTDNFFEILQRSGIKYLELKIWPVFEEMREDRRFKALDSITMN